MADAEQKKRPVSLPPNDIGEDESDISVVGVRKPSEQWNAEKAESDRSDYRNKSAYRITVGCLAVALLALVGYPFAEHLGYPVERSITALELFKSVALVTVGFLFGNKQLYS